MSALSPKLADFLGEAERVTVADCYRAAGFDLAGLDRKSLAGPCPACGGRDRFSLDLKKDVWNCRGFGGGRGLKLIQHALQCSYVEAAEVALGRPRPSRQDAAEYKAAQERMARAREANAASALEAEARRDAQQAVYAEQEKAKARTIWEGAAPAPGSLAEMCLRGRNVWPWPAGQVTTPLRFIAACKYWHNGQPIWTGPAMAGPFVNAEGGVDGVHLTWLDPKNPPKFRKMLESDGQALPQKKMRGAKKGRLIPLAGRMRLARWVLAEGIETGLALAAIEGLRPDTFYGAAGDLGNLTGPALAASAFDHPSLRTEAGRTLRVAGHEPDFSHKAIAVPAHVTALVLAADGDSERVMTAAAMVRAKARHGAAGRAVSVVWPPEGAGDFAEWRQREQV